MKKKILIQQLFQNTKQNMLALLSILLMQGAGDKQFHPLLWTDPKH